MLEFAKHVCYAVLKMGKELVALVGVCRWGEKPIKPVVIPDSYNIEQPYQMKIYGRKFEYVCFLFILGLWYVSFASKLD